jgi:hypothetical protein
LDYPDVLVASIIEFWNDVAEIVVHLTIVAGGGANQLEP